MTPDERDSLREAGPTEDTLRMAADLYTIAYVLGERPAKVVADTFEVPRSTVDSWLRTARRKGFLAPAAGPGKAGA